jgi:adenylate kinase
MSGIVEGPLRLVIFGRQGAGKGTQCARLVEHFGIAHISTGDMLRAAVAAETDMGLKAQTVMSNGGLVGDDIMNGIVRDRLDEEDANTGGFVLDGYPRTVPQAEALSIILGKRELHAAVNIDVPLEEVTKRMKARGREDDTDEGIARRLELYEQETQPVLGWFGARDRLVTVDGFDTEDEVWDRLISTIKGAAS